VDLQAARSGHRRHKHSGANSVSVAELTVGLLPRWRQIPEGASALRQGNYPRLAGVSLRKGRGIVGLERWQGAQPPARRLRLPDPCS
jgi:phosphoglycerate dehydrogenase-like enzyme